jgi:hypothetical protein
MSRITRAEWVDRTAAPGEVQQGCWSNLERAAGSASSWPNRHSVLVDQHGSAVDATAYFARSPRWGLAIASQRQGCRRGSAIRAYKVGWRVLKA